MLQLLRLAEGVWFALVVDCGRNDASEDSVYRMLDTVERRMENKISLNEFEKLFENWMVEGNFDSPPVVSSQLFSRDILRRNFTVIQLSRILGTIVNEKNKFHMAILKQTVTVDTGRNRLALIEKLFFSLDKTGKGYLTVTDMFHLVVGTRIKNSRGTFGLKHVIRESVEFLEAFGALNGGCLSIGKFKESLLKSNKKEMEIQKYIVSLGSVQLEKDLWIESILPESFLDISIVLFLGIKSPRIRWQCSKLGILWGSDQEIERMWIEFCATPAAVNFPDGFKAFEHVCFRFVGLLSEVLSELFPDSFEHDPDYFVDDGFAIEDTNRVVADSELACALHKIHQNLDTIAFPGSQGLEEPFLLFGNTTDEVSSSQGATYIDAFRIFESENRSQSGLAEMWSSMDTDSRKHYLTKAWELSEIKGSAIPNENPASKISYLKTKVLTETGGAVAMEAMKVRRRNPGTNRFKLNLDIVMERLVTVQLEQGALKNSPGYLIVPSKYKDSIAKDVSGHILFKNMLHEFIGGSWIQKEFTLYDNKPFLFNGKEQVINLVGARIAKFINPTKAFQFNIQTSNEDTHTFFAAGKQEWEIWFANLSFIIVSSSFNKSQPALSSDDEFVDC